MLGVQLVAGNDPGRWREEALPRETKRMKRRRGRATKRTRKRRDQRRQPRETAEEGRVGRRLEMRKKADEREREGGR